MVDQKFKRAAHSETGTTLENEFASKRVLRVLRKPDVTDTSLDAEMDELSNTHRRPVLQLPLHVRSKG